MPRCSACPNSALVLHSGRLCPECYAKAVAMAAILAKPIRKKVKREPRPKWRDSLDPSDYKICKGCNKPMAPHKVDYPSLYWKRDTHGGKCYIKFLRVIRLGNQNARKDIAP